jgi:DNA-3-methyladenine glycosylase II
MDERPPRREQGDAAMTELEATAAREYLTSLDDPIAGLAEAHGEVDALLPVREPHEDRFARLAFMVVGQSISVKSATAIFGRLTGLFDGGLPPERLAVSDPEELRAVGLSHAKARALRELAANVVDHGLDLESLDVLSDEEAEARLVSLRGIGPWTAQLFLLWTLGRADVFPAADVGLRHGIKLLDSLDAVPSTKDAEARALAWRPYRSYAAKYLWINYELAVT